MLGPARARGSFVDNLAGQQPVVVMIASTLASVSSTWQAGRYAYRTSKAALNMPMRSAGAWYETRGSCIHFLDRTDDEVDLSDPLQVFNKVILVSITEV